MLLSFPLLFAVVELAAAPQLESRPPTCFGEHSLRDAVRRTLIDAAVANRWPTMTVEVADRAAHNGEYLARLWMDWGDEVEFRELRAENCKLLLRAASLVVAIAIESHASEAGPARPQDVSGSAIKKDVPAWAFALATRVLVQATAKPEQTGIGGMLHLEFGRSSWRLQFGLRYAANPLARTLLAPAPSLRIDWWTLPMTACFVPARARWRFPICGGLDFGWTQARGLRVLRPEKVRRAWLAFEPGLGLEWSFTTKWRVDLDFGISVPLIRRRFHIDGHGTVYTAPSLSVRPAIGLAYLWK